MFSLVQDQLDVVGPGYDRMGRAKSSSIRDRVTVNVTDSMGKNCQKRYKAMSLDLPLSPRSGRLGSRLLPHSFVFPFVPLYALGYPVSPTLEFWALII
jgi:hypothetical protein